MHHNRSSTYIHFPLAILTVQHECALAEKYPRVQQRPMGVSTFVLSQSPKGLQFIYLRPPSHTSSHCKSLAGFKKKSLSDTYSYLLDEHCMIAGNIGYLYCVNRVTLQLPSKFAPPFVDINQRGTVTSTASPQFRVTKILHPSQRHLVSYSSYCYLQI